MKDIKPQSNNEKPKDVNDQAAVAEQKAAHDEIAVKSHIMLGITLCAFTLFAAFTGLLPGGQKSIDIWTGLLFGGDAGVAYDNICSGHGVLTSDNNECFCDLGWTGPKCETDLSVFNQNKPVKDSSVLIVTDSFSSLRHPTLKDGVADAAASLNSMAYEELAYVLANQGFEVSVLFVGHTDHSTVDGKRYQAMRASMKSKGVELIQLPAVPVSFTGAHSSPVTEHSYAVFRYLVSTEFQFKTIMSPAHSSLLYHTLIARGQGLACFSASSFVTHFDQLPKAMLARLENSDPEGSGYGKQYGGSEAQIAETQKQDYMSRKQTELSDQLYVSGEEMKQYLQSELKWEVRAPEINVFSEVPALVESINSHDGELEFVFVGAPQLSIASGVKVVADALDLLKARASGENFHITFLGQSVELTNPKLNTEDFLDLRAYNWPSADWKVVQASTPAEILNYLTAGKNKKVAVLPHLLSGTAGSYLLKVISANSVPVILSRSASAENLIKQEDWNRVFFASNNAKALSDSLVGLLKAGQTELPQARLINQPTRESIMKTDTSVFKMETPLTCAKKLDMKSSHDELPLISVVIVHHDRVDLLKQALKSIEEQTYPQDRLEVILVDDGSTDPETVQFINNLAWQWWEGKGWKVVREPQRWLGAARNVGVRYAKGTYVMFLDDDDVAKSHKIETMANVVVNTAADVITSGHDVFNSKNYPQANSKSMARGRFIPIGAAGMAGVFQNVFGDAGFMVKKSFFVEVGGFTEDFGVGFEDYEFLARVALDSQATMEAIPESLTWYRKMFDGNSLTEATDLKQNQVRVMRPYVDRFATMSNTDQHLVRYAQDRLFSRATFDNAFVNSLNITMTSTTIVGTSTSTVLATQTPTTQPCNPDQCGVCNGDGTSCVDCNNVFKGGAVRDRCGVCEGDGSTCFLLNATHPNIIPNKGGITLTLVGAGFVTGMDVFVNDILIDSSRVTVLSSGSLTVVLPETSIFAPDFPSDGTVISKAFKVHIENGARSGIVYLTVYEGSLVNSVSPTEDNMSSPSTVTVSGSGFLFFAGSSPKCWFSYTELAWNADYTALEAKTSYQGTTATYVDATEFTCGAPSLFDSSNAVIDLSYTGYGHDGVYDSVSGTTSTATLGFFVDKSAGAVDTIQYKAPAPRVVETYFTPDGSAINIVFDAETELALSTISTCNDLFVTMPGDATDAAAAGLDDSTYAKLSDGLPYSDCTFGFTDPLTLWVSISISVAVNNPTKAADVGKIIKIRDGTLKLLNERFYFAFSGESLPIEAPASPLAPSVNPVVPQHIGSCSPLGIDLTGSTHSGGRHYAGATFTMADQTVPGSDVEVNVNAALATAAANAITGVLAFDLDYLLFTGASATYEFTFSLTNFLNATGTQKVTVEFDEGKFVPTITVVGPFGSVQRKSLVTLVGHVEFLTNAECLANLGKTLPASVDLKWALVGGTGDNTNHVLSAAEETTLGIGTNTVTITPFFFAVGTYHFELTLPSDGSTYVYKYDVVYSYDELHGEIAGGSRSVSYFEDLVVDAQVDDPTWIDQTEHLLHASEYGYIWDCELINGDQTNDCRDSQANVLALGTNFELAFAKESLPSTATGECYKFSVTVTHTVSGRSSSTSFVCISIVKQVIPHAKLISTVRKPLAGNSLFALNVEVDNAAMFGTLEYIWSSRHVCDRLPFTAISLTSDVINSKAGANTLSFKTKPTSALSPGTSYCIGVVVRDSVTNVEGEALYRFSTRDEPSGGVCEIDGASSGTQLTTEFKFVCRGWSTDILNGNIFYRYVWLSPDNTKHVLALRSTSSVFTYVFGVKGTHTLLIEITDKAGGYSRTVPQLSVSVAGGGDSSAFLTALEENFSSTGNTEVALRSLSAAVHYFNEATQNGKRDVILDKRQTITLQQRIFNQLQAIVSATNPDHESVGPVVVNMFRALVKETISQDMLLASMQLLEDLGYKMNQLGRDSKGCYTTTTATELLEIMDSLVTTAETSAGFNVTSVHEKREGIIQYLAACIGRTIVCDANGEDLPIGSGNLTVGTASLGSGTTAYGNNVFVIENFSGALNSTSCVNYRSEESKNYLANNQGLTLGNTVFALDFRSAASNTGGKARGSNSLTPTLGSDHLDPVFDPPINITLPIDEQYQSQVADGSYEVKCVFFERFANQYENGNWDDSGCTVAETTATHVVCQCTHLTEYAISVSRARTTPEPTPPPGPGVSPGAIAGAVIGSIAVLGIVGLLGYRAVDRKQKIDGSRVVPIPDNTKDTAPVAGAATEAKVTVRDPSLLPAYFLPPSYDEHMQMKNASDAESKRQEKLNVLLKEQEMDEGMRKNAELP